MFGFCVSVRGMENEGSDDCDTDDAGDSDDGEEEIPGQARRFRRCFSLNQKIDFIDNYQLEHAIGIQHAETPTSFAIHHRLAPQTFRRWLNNEDDLRAAQDRSTVERRRRMRQRQSGTHEQGKLNLDCNEN